MPPETGAARTLGEAIALAATALQAGGVEAPRRESRQLAALVLGCEPAALIARDSEAVDAVAERRLRDLAARRSAGVPFQHLSGIAPFHGHAFLCDARALVPRADSECVVEAALDQLSGAAGGRVADLGTGSGCLVASILLAREDLSGAAVEADMVAAALAAENFARFGLTGRIDLVTRGWADWTGWGDCRLIVSNPPYVARGEIDQLQPEVRVHDPRLALDGGEDGLDAYREIAALAGARMAPGAALVLEVGAGQADAVAALLSGAGLCPVETRTDLSGTPRAVTALR